MAHLRPRVRDKAIEIADALLAQGYDDGKAIRIGIAQAKRWAETHDPAAARMPPAPLRAPHRGTLS